MVFLVKIKSHVHGTKCEQSTCIGTYIVIQPGGYIMDKLSRDSGLIKLSYEIMDVNNKTSLINSLSSLWPTVTDVNVSIFHFIAVNLIPLA